jgi:hypothetical protein
VRARGAPPPCRLLLGLAEEEEGAVAPAGLLPRRRLALGEAGCRRRVCEGSGSGMCCV